MRAAARVLVGTHDFSSFRANGCQSSSPVRTVTRIDVRETPTNWPAPDARGVSQKISVDVAAPSFLYHQVRLIVGALKAVGAGDITVDDVRAILDAKDVAKCPQMAPACGLYLADVHYLDAYAVRPSYARLAGERLQDGASSGEE
jgi:tRNA pseudouridine38-40 synthase